MYAVIATGGRQYKVTPGEVLEVNRLPVEVGERIDLSDVLLISGDAGTQIGHPTVPGAVVRATVAANFRSKKIIVFKYKSKVRYKRMNTHRQDLTRLVIREILTGAEVAPIDSTAQARPTEEPLPEPIAAAPEPELLLPEGDSTNQTESPGEPALAESTDTEA